MIELYHHGIKGQRWGVRRYQNQDGTLNAAGIKRLWKMENRKQKYQKLLDRNRSELSSREKSLLEASENYRQAKGRAKVKAGWNKIVAKERYFGFGERAMEENMVAERIILSIVAKQEKMLMSDARSKDFSNAKDFLEKFYRE